MLLTKRSPNLRVRDPAHSDMGFTIMELLIVLTLIGILSAMSMPSLKGFAATRRLKASAHALRDLLLFARDMAITDRNAHLVVLDLEADRFWLASSETFNPENPLASTLAAQSSTAAAARQNSVPASSDPAGNALPQGVLARASGILGVPYTTEQGITLAGVMITRNGRNIQIDSGAAYIYFSPTSTSEDTLVYLRNPRNQIMSVTVEAASGRTSVRRLTPQEITLLGLDSTPADARATSSQARVRKTGA